MKHLGRGGIVVAALVALSGVFATSASAVVFSNPGSIAINDAGADGTGNSVPANATPYPSNIVASGVSGAVTDVNVTLKGFSHSFPDDVGILLVSPSGAALLLQDGAGDDPDVSGVNTTFDDSASALLPDNTAWASGTYKPTSYYADDPFPTPGPGTAYNNPNPAVGGRTLASTFNGSAANGTWRLFVRDFVNGENGVISGGWSLELNNPPPLPPFKPSLPIVHNTPPPPLDHGPLSMFCGGKSPTKIGTSGPDTIVGTSAPDVIAGLGGNDTIKGLGANDTLCGGGGSDKLKGGSGADTLKGGGGSDTCKGGGSSDAASGCEIKKSVP
jgi:Ca2+-binding RTX toxin-like protein